VKNYFTQFTLNTRWSGETLFIA